MTEHPINSPSDYVIRIHDNPLEIDAAQWNHLLAQSSAPTPFMRHEYLAALHRSQSAVAKTGWTPQFIALHAPDGRELLAACPMYLKTHSYGEYVFDWAWARAYQEHGLRYYPKALVAVPFTPVPGSRFLAKNSGLLADLLDSLLSFCERKNISSCHTLFASDDDQTLAASKQLMLRETVQFHWSNPGYSDFDAYLATLAQDKRKKIRAERRKVQEAGVSWRSLRGAQISSEDWDFFYACYERTYLEHGNPPYLSREFFHDMQHTMPENWLLFIATQDRAPIACSLIALQDDPIENHDATNLRATTADFLPAIGTNSLQNTPKPASRPLKTAYGRYWGALQRVDSLHFDACYYQPLQWCIDNGFDRFEGGAQGEHKMARGLLPIVTRSAHWLAHPQFSDAVERFLEQEKEGISAYVEHLGSRSPFREL